MSSARGAAGRGAGAGPGSQPRAARGQPRGAPDEAEDAVLLAQALDLRYAQQPAEPGGAPDGADGVRSLELLERPVEREPRRADWAQVLGLALLRRTERRLAAGRTAEALAFADRAERVWRPLAESPAAASAAGNDVADLDQARARALAAGGEAAAARAALERGLTWRRRAVAAAGEAYAPALGLARDLALLSRLLLSSAEEVTRALATLEESQQLLERLKAVDPTTPEPDFLVIAGLLKSRGRWRLSAEQTARALDDPAVRRDLPGAARWLFVRRASPAAEAWGPDAAAWRTRALEVPTEDVRERRTRLATLEGLLATASGAPAAVLEAERREIQAVLQAARTTDPALGGLRDDARVEALVPRWAGRLAPAAPDGPARAIRAPGSPHPVEAALTRPARVAPASLAAPGAPHAAPVPPVPLPFPARARGTHRRLGPGMWPRRGFAAALPLPDSGPHPRGLQHRPLQQRGGRVVQRCRRVRQHPRDHGRPLSALRGHRRRFLRGARGLGTDPRRRKRGGHGAEPGLLGAHGRVRREPARQ